ncbi:GspE/PulE family protein [Thermogemmata fonticola]|uniref:Flp pilus assembly complex ATPase component TadA n=1 Tax=Thermogemmata fonticola TaxID=2755323 RepID=A0A7V8VDB6_9BACT|nr:ATPase, T2SS/T4P/T4SS family [Thermogemmata fonticola]MBA2225965.1 Flp pilus assembly complex ATPase component TadA [Thermogemmata fonticola]
MPAPTPPNDKSPAKKPAVPASGTSTRPASTPTAPAASKAAAATPSAPAPPQKASTASKPASAASRPAASARSATAPSARQRFAHIDATTRQLGQKLLDLGLLDEAQLESLYEEMRTTERRLGELALERGLVNEEQLLQATAEVHGLKVLNAEEVKPQPEALKIVQKNMAELYKLVPLSYDNDTLTVAMADPNNLQAMDDLKNLLGIRNVQPVLALPRQIEELLKKAYSEEKEESITSLIAQLEASNIGVDVTGRENSIDLDDALELANSQPVRKLINMVLLMAIRDHASDIHFEPFEDEYKMRYRCDGVLYEMVPPPRHLASAIASRIKVMANLDIAERRLPQDGRIELNVGGNPVDMRVSVLPTMFGESVVIRVLDRTNVGLRLDNLGMPPDLLAQFRAVIRKPNGIILVTGPTGAGKTTTLYSALAELNDIEVKIITTEDPVEYEIDGIVQCPINPDIDLTFANALRAILRQDPDIILVGEIRDLETAQIAIQASLTGHLVFSTLHTNDAPSSITRLRDMGIEPYLITATVEAIQAQRLVRKICTACRTPYQPTREQLMELNLRPEDLRGRPFYYGEGCDKCNNLGFKGRTGLFELMIMNDDLRDMVSRGASTDALRQYTRKMGTLSLRDAGLRALFAGVTTIDEVVRETVLEDEG